jgi:hypothetical protein
MQPARLSRLLPLRWRVRLQQVCAQAACSDQRPMSQPTPSASSGACSRGQDQGALRHTVRHDAPGLQERDELALGLRIALDVALRHGETGMAGELLHVPETPADLGHFVGSPGNEGAAPRMRRTAMHLQ